MPLSRLKPDTAVITGLLTAAGVFLIFQTTLPRAADIIGAEPHDVDIEKSRKAAAWQAFGLVAIVTAVTRDINTYVIGGAALATIDYMYKHANATNPATGQLDDGGEGQSIGDYAAVHPLPDYVDAG